MSPSLRSRLLAGAMTVMRAREQFNPEKFTKEPSTAAQYSPPPSLKKRVTITRSTFRDWPVFTLAPETSSGKQALYLHGGAWAAEIQARHWNLVADLAVGTSRTFVVPIFPLVPAVTHRDITPVLTDLWLATAQEVPTALVGDSSGATMALNLLVALAEGSPAPDATVLLSPTFDLTFANPESARIAPHDPLLKLDHIRALASSYAGPDGPDSALVSPVHARVDHLGAITVFTGTRDLLNPDAHRFADLARDAPGTQVTVEETAGVVHDWMLMPIPEAKTTRVHIARLLR
ncbi:alpha/beta hydrolase fold domain-containing protein [Amycolatopsis sp. NPDC006125]|uniref:alpha/beta hydrolase fold domain-containing protein n=1 Tax=Amycolatopsis sp. NPDC006125 TaxID=3156730 RepID=UPI0033B98BCE